MGLLAPSAAAAEPEVLDVPPGEQLNATSAEAFLDSIFLSDEAKSQYVGASAIIVKDGEVLAQKGYGYADRESGQPVDAAESVFRIASVSKSFNVAAAMQLVEQGKLALEDDIRKHIGNIAFENPFDNPVTVADLMKHTTGFRIHEGNQDDIHYDLDTAYELESYIRDNFPPVVREPGTSYMYDNFASSLLGLIVQNVSGMPYQEYMDQHLFEPLGMTSSSFAMSEELTSRMVTEYDPLDQPMKRYATKPTYMPDGGMLSTAEDMGKFMIAFLNGGQYGSESILSPDGVKSMTEYRVAIHPLLPQATYGFEAPMQMTAAGASTGVIAKSGGIGGTSTYLFFLPDEHVGVFVTYTKMGQLYSGVYAQFIGAFFPEYAKPLKYGAYVPKSQNELDKFTGYYRNLRTASLLSYITKGEEGGLVISDAFVGPRPLIQVEETLFFDRMTYQLTAFQLDENGDVAYMNEPVLHAYTYAQRGEEAAGFADVDAEHPYREYIEAMQSLGFYDNAAGGSFNPEDAVTRGQFVENLWTWLGIVPISTDGNTPFADVVNHPSAQYIEMAYKMGLIQGKPGGLFNPDQPIARQEAAVIVWRLLNAEVPSELFDDVPLAEGTDAWAVPAVQMLAGFGYYGPETEALEDGSIDFQSKRLLSRAEQSALFMKLLTVPQQAVLEQLIAARQAQ